MTKVNAPRRSNRLLAQRTSNRIHKLRNHSNTVKTKKQRLNTWLQASQSPGTTQEADLELLDEQLSRQLRKVKPSHKSEDLLPISQFFAESASSSGYATGNDSDDEEDAEFGELVDLSGDNVEWSAADDIDTSRHHSYDSRYEPGNEDYDLDGFVVGDGELEEETESIEEQTEDEEIEEGKTRHEDSTDKRRISNTTESTRRSSDSSKLFYSDPDDAVSRPQNLASWSQLEDLLEDPVESLEPLIDLAGADVIEEVMDALALFSRRCNRNRAPLRLRLAAAVLEDEEVREALEWAVQLGLGRKLSLEDGSKRWTIGPKAS